MAGTVRRSIPSPSPWPRPPAETGDTGFHYTIDEETGEIVIRNYRTIEASYHFTCQIGYDFYPYQVADGYEKGEIQADFRVKDSKGDLTAESEQLSVSVHTETKKPEAYKSVNHKYELWQDAWGEKPADAADYFYVEWRLYTTLKRGTQPFTFTLQEDLGDYGEFVGWRATSAGSYTLGSQAEFEQTIFDTDGPNSTATTAYSKTIYVLARYPRSMLETTSVVTNSYTASVNGYDGDTKTATGSRNYTYVAPDLSYKGDYCRASKSSGRDITGGVNLLQAGKSVENYFSVNVTLQGYGMTNDGQDPYTTVQEDELLFLDEKRLEAGDYTLTSFYLTGLRNTATRRSTRSRAIRPSWTRTMTPTPLSPSGSRRRTRRTPGQTTAPSRARAAAIPGTAQTAAPARSAAPPGSACRKARRRSASPTPPRATRSASARASIRRKRTTRYAGEVTPKS